jgi:hypothetical protein
MGREAFRAMDRMAQRLSARGMPELTNGVRASQEEQVNRRRKFVRPPRGEDEPKSSAHVPLEILQFGNRTQPFAPDMYASLHFVGACIYSSSSYSRCWTF